MWIELKNKSDLRFGYFDKDELLSVRAGFLSFLNAIRGKVIELSVDEKTALEKSLNEGKNYPLHTLSKKEEAFHEFPYFENWVSYYFLRAEFSKKEIEGLSEVFDIMLVHSIELCELCGHIDNKEMSVEALFVFTRTMFGLSCAAFVAKWKKTGIIVQEGNYDE